jgi:uncharacterized protein GlcG (DUF336 family)
MSDFVNAASSLSLAGARLVLDRALAHAEQLNVPVCAAVTDRAGHLLAFVRMDGAPLLSAQIAQNKAYSVVAFNGLPTHAWWDAIADDPSLRSGIVHTDRLVIFGGGVPVEHAGEVVGAIGVSGGSADQDCAIAKNGAEAFH